MARSNISPAKAVLLAVQLAGDINISALRILISQNRKPLRTEIVLRILLSHLPECVDPSEYVAFLQDLVDGNLADAEEPLLDASTLKDVGEIEASQKVKKLHLLPLAWPNAPADAPEDPLVRFLIHRSIRIDHNTGLIDQIPKLIGPFLQRSSDLRTWMISTVLPLLRLSYEYYPGEEFNTTISDFELMDDKAGIALLLSATGKSEVSNNSRDTSNDTVGRDLKGLVGPWMYGDNRLKRRKLRDNSNRNVQTIHSHNEVPVTHEKCASWEVVFKWMTIQAKTSWKTAVQVIDQWDGPGDVDLGGYEDNSEWLDEEDQQHLERRYAQAAIASAYLISEPTLEALMGIHRILSRIVSLLELDSITTLEADGNMLKSVDDLGDLLQAKNTAFLRNGHLDETNILTTPNEASLKFLHALLISAYIFTKQGTGISIRKAAELALSQQDFEQRAEFKRLLMVHNGRGPKADDRYWKRTRSEFLWLRNWVSNGPEDNASTDIGRGVFGKLSTEEVEIALLKTFLTNNREFPSVCEFQFFFVLMDQG